MQPAVAALTAALDGITLAAPRVPVWGNVTARPYTDGSEIKPALARQVVEPVQWEATIRGLLASGVERFYEVGPGRVLAGLLKRIERKADCRHAPA
jgi:[acyl-carrier-protein] S-malonyltransferase